MKLDFKRDFKESLWQDIAKSICQKHKIPCNFPNRSEHGESIVFLIDERFVIKLYVPFKDGFEREQKALEIADTNLKLPEIVASGEFEDLKYLITTQIHGEQLTRDLWLKFQRKEQISILSQLAAGLRELHRSDATQIDFDWHKFVRRQAETCVGRQKACGVNHRILEALPAFVEENLKLLPADFQPVFLHGDVHFGNLRFKKRNGRWQISGLFDFADSLKGFLEYDFLAAGLLMIQGQGDLQREFFRFFDYADNEIDETLRKRLMLLTCFYEWSDLRRYAIRLRPEAIDYSLEELETAIWNFC